MIEYFLEHPTRGILVAQPGDRDEKFHWAWSKPRNEALKLPNHHKALSLRDALPPNMREGTCILCYDDQAEIGHRYKVVYE